MNRFILLICLLMPLSLTTAAQAHYQKIETFTKVWGFLKYHHPVVATGSLNWDSVFINTIPKLQNIQDEDFNSLLLRIIGNLDGRYQNEAAKRPDTLFAQNFDLKWIDEVKNLRSALKNKLKQIYNHRNGGENKYIKPAFSTSDYSGENRYEDIGFPNHNYRLLFLARFWNAINYFAPYKYVIGEDWHQVLTRFVPRVINAADSLSYYKVMLQLAVALNDGHAQFTIANSNTIINDVVFGKYTAPVFADIADAKVIIRKLAVNNSEMLPGDIVVSVDGEPIEVRMRRLGVLISASNAVSRNNYITRVLLNTKSHQLALKIKRGSKIFTLRVKCMLAAERSWTDLNNYTANKTGYEMVGKSIVRVYAAQIWRGNIDTIKTLVKANKAVIFDVRNYPNNDEFYKLFDVFLPEGKVINESLIMSVNHPGYFKWQPSPKIGRYNPSFYRGRVIILADERTQSQGEYSVMALQTIPGAVTIGSQTAGGDGVQTLIPMGNKMALSYSGYGIFYPDKTPTQRRGIRIDIEAKKTAESIAQDNDVALEKALKHLKGKGVE